MPRIRPLFAAALTVALVALGACTSDKSKGPSDAALPDGSEVLRASATAMGDIKTARFQITADGNIAGVALKRAEGVLTREGNAQGSAQVDQLGTMVELSFVIVGDKVYLKGPTGGYQQLPLALAATVYDPSAILDPQRGIAKLLTTATEAKIEGEEDVAGQRTTRVVAKLTAQELSAIVPGVTTAAPGKLWVANDSKRLVKATFQLPDLGQEKGGSVTITFTEFDAPVSISAPA
jgi:lipoprotein LprG